MKLQSQNRLPLRAMWCRSSKMGKVNVQSVVNGIVFNEVKLEPTTAHRARPKVGGYAGQVANITTLNKVSVMKSVYQQALANLTVCLVVALLRFCSTSLVVTRVQ